MTRRAMLMVLLLAVMSLSVDAQFRFRFLAGGAADPPEITSSNTLPSGTEDVSYSQTLTATGGTPGYTWCAAPDCGLTGALPTGIGLNPATGALTGTPTVSGDFAFQISVTDSLSAMDTETFTLSIAAAATGECTGENPDDRWTCMMGLTMTTKIGYQFRSMVEIDQWASANPPVTNVSYCFSGTQGPAQTIANINTTSDQLRVSTANHALVTGASVTIAGNSSTPNINGTWTIARIDSDEFTLQGGPNITAMGTAGTFTAACTTDPYSNKQNAWKVVIPQGGLSIAGSDQVIPTINLNTGDVLITEDMWFGPELKLGADACTSSGFVERYKLLQMPQAPAEGSAARWLEPRTNFGGVDAVDQSGTAAGWDPVTSVTAGTHIASVDLRKYGDGALTGDSGDLQLPQDANFLIRKNSWTAMWVLVEVNQGSGWNCGPVSGNFDQVSVWMADEVTGVTRLSNRVNREMDRLNYGSGGCTGDETLVTAGTVQSLKNEINTSAGTCVGGLGQAATMYFRNFFAGNASAITPAATTITVDGTNVALSPKP